MQAKTAEESGDYVAAAKYRRLARQWNIRGIICGTVNYVVCGIIYVIIVAVIIYLHKYIIKQIMVDLTVVIIINIIYFTENLNLIKLDDYTCYSTVGLYALAHPLVTQFNLDQQSV